MPKTTHLSLYIFFWMPLIEIQNSSVVIAKNVVCLLKSYSPEVRTFLGLSSLDLSLYVVQKSQIAKRNFCWKKSEVCNVCLWLKIGSVMYLWSVKKYWFLWHVSKTKELCPKKVMILGDCDFNRLGYCIFPIKYSTMMCWRQFVSVYIMNFAYWYVRISEITKVWLNSK